MGWNPFKSNDKPSIPTTDHLKLKLMDDFNYADQLIKDNKNLEAIKVLESIITQSPEFGKAYNHLGFIYETRIKEMDKAEQYYRLSLHYTPDYTAPYYNYAILLSTAQRWSELEGLLEKAMTVNGINKATIYNEYGIMFEQQGKFQEALNAYKQCVVNSLDNNTIETAEKSIVRCRKKIDIMDI